MQHQKHLLYWYALPVPSRELIPPDEAQKFDMEDWGGDFNMEFPVLIAELPDETVQAWGLKVVPGGDTDSITAIVGMETQSLADDRAVVYIVCGGPATPADFSAWKYFDSYLAAWEFANQLHTGMHHSDFTVEKGWQTNGVVFK